MSVSSCRIRNSLVAALAAAGAAIAQGEFVNFECAPVKPVAIAEVAGSRFVLLCNVPDNSVEIYNAATYAFVRRVPVGLSPVTVRWNPVDQCFYTCNFLGDSISQVQLTIPVGTTLRVDVMRTEWVGDEPTDIAFFANGTEALVTRQSLGTLSRRSLPGLQEIEVRGLWCIPSPVPDLTYKWALKAPRNVLVLPDQRFLVLNLLAGQVSNTVTSRYDFGMFIGHVNASTTVPYNHVKQLGSSNFAFSLSPSGDQVLVAAQVAQNELQSGGANGVHKVANLPTGFVQTWLKVYDLQTGQNLPVPEAATTALLPSINLNRDYLAPGLVHKTGRAIAQVTDVTAYADGTDTRVALTAFGSDHVVLLKADASVPGGYSIVTVDLRPLEPIENAVGPRGLAHDSTGGSGAGRLWVLNFLTHSFTVLDARTGGVLHGANLAANPTPTAIRVGRPFLYSARGTSGSGVVSCASCHLDGRTDALAWKLGKKGNAEPVAASLHDPDPGITTVPQDTPSDKGALVTQTLQGLLNSHVEAPGMSALATNAPYHWRGDKGRFQDFNEAFVNLLGMLNVGSNEDPRGLDPLVMDTYTAFVNTIHHPPNPDQPIDRVVSGSFGLPNNLDDGTGAGRGLKLFHIARALGDRSCADCHTLPEGSGNTITEGLTQTSSEDPTLYPEHPFESAATRNLRAREACVVNGFSQTNDAQIIRNGAYGLLHGGFLSINTAPTVLTKQKNSLSINDFIQRTFTNDLNVEERRDRVVEFVRQMDTGVAPIVGRASTFTSSAGLDAALNLAEGQAAEANAGVALFVHQGGVATGYWYDLPTGLYRSRSGATLDHNGVITLAGSGNGIKVVVQSTPTGSERRIAFGGSPAAPVGAPSAIVMLPMVPSTAYVGITDFTWKYSVAQSMSSSRVRLFQAALNNNFGVPIAPGHLRNEPPRRFRVAADGIRIGAKLVIAMRDAAMNKTIVAKFDLAPTSRIEQGKRVWESAEELDPLETMIWLFGGYSASGVQTALAGGVPTLMLDTTWNDYDVHVQNPDGSTSPVLTTSLSIADQR